MLVVALSPAYVDGGTISTKLAGIVLASLSSGMGELSFVGLTHFYGPFSLAAWGSGTGAAGLIGAGAYALATTSLGLQVKTTLLTSAFLPAVLAVSFFMILPRSPMHAGSGDGELHANDSAFDDDGFEEREGLLGSSIHSMESLKSAHSRGRLWQSLKSNLRRAQGLFFPLYALSASLFRHLLTGCLVCYRSSSCTSRNILSIREYLRRYSFHWKSRLSKISGHFIPRITRYTRSESSSLARLLPFSAYMTSTFRHSCKSSI